MNGFNNHYKSQLNVKIKKLDTNAVIPKYSKHGDAGLDLTVVSKSRVGHAAIKYDFGLAFEIPLGYVGLLFPRSSIYKKNHLLTNSVGVIDSGYRGEVSAVMHSVGVEQYEIGEKAVQLIIMPYPQIEFEEVEELSETERGTGGYGSTGK